MSVATLSDDLAMALDPVAMAESIGRHLDKWQRDALSSRARRQLWNACRQAGKSTTVSVLACHTALYEPGSLTLILSPGERQSKETFCKVMDVYHALGRPVPADAETKLEIELANGSRIVALPGTEGTIRGYSGVDLLIIDEASRVDDLLYAAVRPMLAVSGGRLVALSTPWGKRGWWYDAWTSTQPWDRVKVTALDCPRISAEFLKEERDSLGDLFFFSEYMATFVDTVGQVFSTELVDSGETDEFQPLFGMGASGADLLGDEEDTWPSLLG